VTRPAHPEPAVRYVVSSEPGERAELVTALGRLAVQLRQAEREAAGQDEGQGPPIKKPAGPDRRGG